MMNTNAKIYSEVDGVISAMGEEYRSKVPKKLKELILKHKDNSIDVKYDMSNPLTEQGISKEALSMIALIHLNYWCKNEEEKVELNRIFKENAIKNEEEKNKLYSPDNIFKNKKSQIQENIAKPEEQVSSKNMQIIEYKENVFKRFIKYIKSIFSKNRKL